MWEHTHAHLQGITFVLRSKKSRSLNFATVFTASFEYNEAEKRLTALAISEVCAAAAASIIYSQKEMNEKLKESYNNHLTSI